MRIREIKTTIKEHNDDLFAEKKSQIIARALKHVIDVDLEDDEGFQEYASSPLPRDVRMVRNVHIALKLALDYFIRGKVIAGCGALETLVNDGDWDEWIIDLINDATGIDLFDIVDHEDEEQESEFYMAKEQVLAAQKAATQVNESALSEAPEVAEPPEEPRKKTTTKTKTKPDVNYDPFQQQPDQPLANRPDAGPKDANPDEPKQIRKASAADTRRAAGNVGMTPAMSQMFSRMQNIQIDPDLEPYEPEEPETLPSTKVNTENLPAVAGQALRAAGVEDPDFHRLSSLPGNMSGMVRQLSRLLFGGLTNTPANNIYTVANLGGRGPNSTQEVNAVANWILKNGEDLGEVHVDFSNIMPGYTPEQRQYSAEGIRWLLVRDFAGNYIYCWPETDSKTPNNQAQLGREPKRLGENDLDMFGSEDQYSSKARLGKRVTNAFGRIYDSTPDADDALNYLDNQGELYNYLMDKHKYDIDIIIAKEPETVLKELALELERIADELESGI